jgi:hypothetical protein
VAENKNARDAANTSLVRDLAQNALLGSGKTFETTIDYLSDVGTEIKGSIVFHKPNSGEIMKMAGIKTMYIQSQFLDDEGDPIAVDPVLIDSMLTYVAEVVSSLKVVVDKVDEGLEFLLKPEEYDEIDVLFHVYGRYQAWRNSFRRPDTSESGGTNGGTKS